MDALTRERYGPTPRGPRPRPFDDDLELIVERQRGLVGEPADRHLAAVYQAARLRAARLHRDRLLVRAIRKANP